MLNHLKKYKVILGSNSPRRKELLSLLEIAFEVEKFTGEEHYPETLPAADVAEFLARLKSEQYTDFSKNQLYITADTVVIHQNQVLGKPKSKAEAVQILQQLSGTTNKVTSGVCVKTKTHSHSFSNTTEVTFSTLSAEQINHYVNTYQPLDKAGSYGIQEWIGLTGIEKINGSYVNVVGLPTQPLYAYLMTLPAPN